MHDLPIALAYTLDKIRRAMLTENIEPDRIEITMTPDAVPIVGPLLVKLRAYCGIPIVMPEQPAPDWYPRRSVVIEALSDWPPAGCRQIVTAEAIVST